MTSAIVFVSASRLDPIKGIDFALQVLGELKNTGFLDFHYYILGTGEKQYEAQLNQSIVDFGLTDHVTCVGFVSPKQLHTNGENMLNLYYSAADMFLSLNRALPDGTADASPMNVREAMAAKTVVFAGDSGGSTEIIQPNETGFTLNTNADYSKDIVVLILELINDSKRRNRIAENASAYIRNELTWKIQFGRLQTCIEEKASK
jgi:glycosyltransferase involved in cell wall biosynthesis